MTDFLNTYKTQPAELSVNEVAKILRCSNQMVFKLCLQYKDLSYYKVGNRYWIPKKSVTTNAIQSKKGFVPLWYRQ